MRSGTQQGVRLVAEDLTLGYARPAGRSPEVAAAVLEGISLTLEPGERVAVVGASGSGKTSLLHALAGLLRPLAGRIVADGTVVASSDGPCTSQHAAYMFQRDLLLPWKTALENAALAAAIARPRLARSKQTSANEWAREQAEVLLREFGLGEALVAYPHQLSGGMRQRVALARTLTLGRGLVLLDEPFAGLDALTRDDLAEWMRGVMSTHSATWVLVTHDIREAALLAQRVAVLGGRPADIVGWVETDAPATDSRVAELQRLLAAARSASHA